MIALALKLADAGKSGKETPAVIFTALLRPALAEVGAVIAIVVMAVIAMVVIVIMVVVEEETQESSAWS